MGRKFLRPLRQKTSCPAFWPRLFYKLREKIEGNVVGMGLHGFLFVRCGTVAARAALPVFPTYINRVVRLPLRLREGPLRDIST